ncbi:MAG: sugar transferase [Chloroflexi bacterium]|nr:sugar transferase [Chloroflexota bacterium]
MGKRLFDILASFAGLAITLPLYPFIAVAVKLDSPGPVFFSQSRVGLNGRPFTILKFRTMVRDAYRQRAITMKVDRRVTRVGRWLRGLKLDELPTLWNVLKGEMSLVGPRPELQVYVDHYTPEQRQVLSVRPGITDLGTLRFNDEANLLGDEGQFEDVYLRQILPEKLRLNLEYIARRSFWYDMRIILLTLLLIVRRRN